MTTTCPVCDRTFRDAHGRGGHLATYNDEAHDAFRLLHGLKHPLGPDGKPTLVGARWRGSEPPPTPPVVSRAPEFAPAPEPTLAEPAPAPPETSQAERPPDPTPPQTPLTRATELSAIEQAPSHAKETPAPSPAPESGLWLPFAISVGSLAALVLANKGKNAPKPQAIPARAPPVEAWPGIWTQPDPIQSTGFPYVDRMLGHSGLPATRRRLWP